MITVRGGVKPRRGFRLNRRPGGGYPEGYFGAEVQIPEGTKSCNVTRRGGYFLTFTGRGGVLPEIGLDRFSLNKVQQL